MFRPEFFNFASTGYHWRNSFILLTVLLLGGMLTLMAGMSLQQTEALRQQERIAQLGREVNGAFELEMTRTIEAIRSAGLMLESNPQITREQFNNYMRRLLEGDLSVNLIEWQPIVPATELADFEAAARAAGLIGYQVVQPDSSGSGWEPVSGRTEYVPVLYGWPEHYRTSGLDMSFSPTRMASKLESMARAQPVASGVFALMKDGLVNSGAMAIAVSTTVFAANQQARGYLAAVVDLPTLFNSAAAKAEAASFDFLVFDGEDHTVFSRLGKSSELRQDGLDTRTVTQADYQSTVDFAGQRWSLVLHPQQEFYATEPTSGALLAYCAGAAMTLFVVAFLFAHLRLNARLRQEIAARIAADKVMQQRQLMLERSESMAKMASFEWDVETDVVSWSPEMFRIFGRDPALGIPNLAGQTELYTPHSAQILFEAIERALSDATPYELELMTVQPDGEQRPCLIKCFPEVNGDGRVVRLAGLLQDITERKRAEAEINSLAFYDPLTGLPNRRLLMERLQKAVAASTRHGHYGAILFIDLDNFKLVNDTLGHDMGDLLLKETARRLLSCLREQDIVGRLGGDEFVVMLEYLSTEAQEATDEAQLVGKKILDLLNQPYLLQDKALHTTPSIGITLFANFHGSIDELLKQADLAMYQAKAAGRNNLQFFDNAMQHSFTTHSRL